MAYAYGRAFEELAEPGLALWPKRDDLMQPMVYLARHSMELQLKRAIKDYQDYVGDKSAIATRRIKAYPMLRSTRSKTTVTPSVIPRGRHRRLQWPLRIIGSA